MAARIVDEVAELPRRLAALRRVASPARPRRSDRNSVADVAAPLLDAVVNISTSQTVTGSRSGGDVVPAPQLPEGSPFQDFFDEFFNEQQGDSRTAAPRRVQSLGSGFVIDPSGIIVTNNHVIEGADEITANFTDGSKLPATVIGHDEKTDIAAAQGEADKPLTAVKFGDSNAIRVGDWVMAIGNPFGLGGTVTLGIVSARNRDINSGPYDDFIQTDAAINRGNSGGPLFNMDGESSASTPRSSRRPAARSASASPCRRRSPSTSSTSSASSARRGAAGSACASRT